MISEDDLTKKGGETKGPIMSIIELNILDQEQDYPVPAIYHTGEMTP